MAEYHIDLSPLINEFRRQVSESVTANLARVDQLLAELRDLTFWVEAETQFRR